MEQVQHPRKTSQLTSNLTKHKWLSALSITLFSVTSFACSGVGPAGLPVVFGDQTNIIIWDKDNFTEHFIRNANFKSGADSFGFIAPTPGKPQLSEASNQAFYTLARLAPAFGGYGGGGMGGTGAFGGSSRSDEVKVIQEADVAGYHATTLWAKDPRPINDWMNEHGYVSTPEVERWEERYTSRGWYLTAFKVTDKTRLAASTGTIRMTFKTDKPYNPFYVPQTNIPINGGGTLRVYFVSVGDYDAKIGDGQIWQTPAWKADIPKTTASKLAEEAKLPADAIPAKSEVETFVDNNFPRPAADDIYFKQRPVIMPTLPSAPAPKPVIPPYELVPLVGAAGLFAAARRRRQAV